MRLRSGMTWADAFALMVGVTVTIVIGFYQFGQSNHTVYLLDALRKANPAVLGNDWFTTKTFQYHATFGLLTQMVWRIIEPVFLIGYLGLIVGLHVGWFQLCRLLGGGRLPYVISVLLLYVSGGGTALGVYTFLQDSAFLPSNIASVAMLWGIVLWLQRRPIASGALLAVASIFHLNYAVIAPVLWGVMWSVDIWLSRNEEPAIGEGRSWLTREQLIGTALAIVPAGLSIVLAILAMPKTGAAIPLGEFVDLYVRLRHPHHYDPRSWPSIVWVSFLWPVIPATVGAITVLRSRRSSVDADIAMSWWRASGAYVFFMIVIAIAVTFAGITFVSERLVQMSLYRFSIYPHVLACVATSVWLCQCKPIGRATRWVLAGMIAILLCGAAIYVLDTDVLKTNLGDKAFYQQINTAPIKWLAVISVIPLFMLWVDHTTRRRQDIYAIATLALLSTLVLGWNARNYGLLSITYDPEFARVSRWAKQKNSTPRSAVFLVPPDEESFRLAAQRSIVVNYKGVPQTSRELGQWRDRLQDVLDMPDLRTLPKPMPATLAAIRQRYDELPAEHLIATARKYGCRYVVTTRAMTRPEWREVFAATGGVKQYFVYDLGKTGKP